jgi:ribosomal protein L7/L12
MPTFPPVAIGVFAGLVFYSIARAVFASRKGIDQATLFRITDRLDALLAHAGIRYDSAANLPTEVQEAIQNGDQIKAIKSYRQSTGVGLKESKEFIEGIMTPERQIERKLDALLQHEGIQYDPHANMSSGVLDAIRNGNNIMAIKLYRESTGVGLKEAKDAVDEVARKLK